MPAKRTPEPQKAPRLAASRAQAAEQIAAQIAKGRELLSAEINDLDELASRREERTRWGRYNIELLARLFENDYYARWYTDGFGMTSFGGRPNLAEDLREFRQDLASKVGKMESMLERLDLIPEVDAVQAGGGRPIAAVARRTNQADVFIVHGHDEAAKEAVARFLERLRLRAIILHEQPNLSQTIIEKFERHADVGFAVVLLTPDDLGRSASDAPERTAPRARQNVVFELGYFVGKLGRERVCALHKGNLEMFSDFLGVLFVSLDDGGAWKLKLASELKTAGLAVDTNDAI